MSIELFPLNASVSSGTVTLTWSSNVPGFPPAVSYTVQRKQFGYGNPWTTIASGISASGLNFSQTDTPAVGDWSYQVIATVTAGGVDALGTSFNSQQVNVTTEAATGEVTLVLGSAPASSPAGYTKVQLGFYIAGTAVDVRFYEVQLSVNSGVYRTVGRVDEFENLHWEEVYPGGLGLLSFQVVAHLPSATPPYNQDVLSTSNAVTVTI
jgi:hypothetical protein